MINNYVIVFLGIWCSTMVARDVTENTDSASAENIAENGETLSSRIHKNAEIQIPEYRQQLLDAKENMSSAADMYQQDYLDKVEHRYFFFKIYFITYMHPNDERYTTKCKLEHRAF